MDWKTFDFKAGRTKLNRKIDEILEGDKFKCSLCSGTGILPRTKGINCPTCKGVGMVTVGGPAVVCAYCKGRGEYPPRTSLTCTVCGGRGLVSIAKPVEICNHCRGSGAEPGDRLPCLECKGKGIVTKK